LEASSRQIRREDEEYVTMLLFEDIASHIAGSSSHTWHIEEEA
jgi:hypothetical protein